MHKKISLLFLVTTYVLSACGTLSVKVENTIPEVDSTSVPTLTATLGVGPTPAPTAQAGTDSFGNFYFFDFAQGNNDPAQLMRLPGSCVVGKQACSETQPLDLPENTYPNHSLSWSWSSDGKQVALTSVPGTGQDRLFTSNMPDPTWKQIAQFDFIQLGTWSADDTWIYFGVSNSQGNQEFYVIHPDGSGLKNVTATENLPADGRPYTVDGWIGNKLIVRSTGREAPVYLLNLDSGQVKPLLDSAAMNATFFPSPDGSLLAFTVYDENNQFHTLKVIAPDGTGVHDLASFKTEIFSNVWSPDGNTLVFAVDDESNPSHSAAYLIGRDGQGFMQVYNGSMITRIAFSPDGQFLIATGGDMQQIFVIDLNSLQIHQLQAPGLDPTDRRILPAWTP
jgi:WD40 repeat protein